MLMRTDPFRELDRLTQQVLGTAARPAAMPMDAWRQGDSFYICLDLPGINPDSIDLTVEQNVLTIRAERAPVQADGAQMIVSERPYGTFTRQVFLGETLDAENIGADYAAGVLTLTIPVREAAKPAASMSPAATPSRPSPPSSAPPSAACRPFFSILRSRRSLPVLSRCPSCRMAQPASRPLIPRRLPACWLTR
jgi:HSP20 family protein